MPPFESTPTDPRRALGSFVMLIGLAAALLGGANPLMRMSPFMSGFSMREIMVKTFIVFGSFAVAPFVGIVGALWWLERKRLRNPVASRAE